MFSKTGLILTASVLAAMPGTASAQTPQPTTGQTPPAATHDHQTGQSPPTGATQPAAPEQPAARQPAAGQPAAGQPMTGEAAAPATPLGQVVAATAADLRAGVAVLDASGGRVGEVESVDADGVVVSTGSARAKLPASSFGKAEAGLVISMTRAQLEAAAANVQNPG